MTSSTDGGAATLSGQQHTPGKPGTGSHKGGGANDDAGATGQTAAVDVRAPGSAVVTLADIASFRPTPTAPTAEPNGWAIAGLDANFVAHAPTQVVTGTLLGQPASVRFTAVRYAWTYGDGSTRTSATGGASWAALGVREFDPTVTSHAYATVGDYTARLRISYSAAYTWGDSDFVPIAGTVQADGGALPVHVVTESTVLVGSDCVVNPRGPGCGG